MSLLKDLVSSIKSIGTLIEFIDETRLSEVPKEYPYADKMLENLLLDHESIIRQQIDCLI